MTSSQALWYSTRATGIVALVLLTGSVVLGVLTTVRFGTKNWPKFTFQDVHRRVSLLAMAFVGVHVVTTVSDSFAPIGWISVVVPFTSSYRRLWLGLGTIAVDLLLAVTISSLLRQRINPRSWRALHWLAYGSWPLAVVHAMGTGTDPHLRWVLALVVGCVIAVLGAVAWRLLRGWPARPGTRVVAGATSLVAVIAVAAWSASGPLRPGWAARAGTPRTLLAGAPRIAAGTPKTPSPTTSTTAGTTATLPPPPYQASFSGTITERHLSGEFVQVDIVARTRGDLAAELDMAITGTPDGSGGGVVMQQSRVSFGPPAAHNAYTGQVAGLDGSRILLALANDAGGRLNLRVDLVQSGSNVSGELASVATTPTGGNSDAR
jgi:DMSO/TMAO reductase YedYZ heme-binding membrane subunit